MPNPNAPVLSRNGYVEVDRIEDVDGAMAIFTRRNGSTMHTVSFFKKYERDGAIEKTNFFTIKSLESFKRLFPIAEKRLVDLEEAAKKEQDGKR